MRKGNSRVAYRSCHGPIFPERANVQSWFQQERGKLLNGVARRIALLLSLKFVLFGKNAQSLLNNFRLRSWPATFCNPFAELLDELVENATPMIAQAYV
jgi:hypothetical protein